MTTGPSPEYVVRQLHLSDEAVSDARYLLADGRLKSAVNRVYYAMFHATQAALSQVVETPPKTHSGAIALFSQHFVRTGLVSEQFKDALGRAADLRERGDYDVFANFGEQEVTDLMANAEAFVAEVKRLLGRQGRTPGP